MKKEKKGIKDLDKNLDFIKKVKEEKFSSVVKFHSTFNPRTDEPKNYTTDEEEIPLYSFCN